MTELFSDSYCAEHFWAISELTRWLYLVKQNAYFLWEKRVKAGQPGTPEDDWAVAEIFVAKEFGSCFKPAFFWSTSLPPKAIAAARAAAL